jgi:hypothetical protein
VTDKKMMTENNDSESNDLDVNENKNSDDHFVRLWLANLLAQLDGNMSEETQRYVFKGCSSVHYQRLQMDEITSQYQGNLVGFIKMLADKWNWKVTYDPETNLITADENKKECVCPIVRLSSAPVSAILCHCSEGFAERMFSAVVGRPVQAQVVQSILRGNPTCIYRIQI